MKIDEDVAGQVFNRLRRAHGQLAGVIVWWSPAGTAPTGHPRTPGRLKCGTTGSGDAP